MATKKGKRPTTASRKQSAKSESTTRSKRQTTKPEVEEVVEVVEVEAPVLAMPEGATFTEKLAALNPARLAAELVGTFILTAVFIRLINNTNYGLIVIALTISALVMIGRVHLNPAITFARWILRKIDGVKAATFIVAQVLGAVLAFFALTGINNAGFDYKAAIKSGVMKAGVTEQVIKKAGGLEKWALQYGGIDTIAKQLGITKEAPKLYQYSALAEGKEWVAMLGEMTGAIVLGLGAGYAYDRKKKHQRTAKGLVIGLCWLAGLVISTSNASNTILNPAVASTMGVFGWGSTNAFLWPVLVYVLGTVVGTTIGILIYHMLSDRIKSGDCDCQD